MVRRRSPRRRGAAPWNGRAGLTAGLLAVFVAAGAVGAPARAEERRSDLTSVSLEALMEIEVTSVSKRREPWFEAPAAVHVITREDIRRAGVTTIAEALRLAPGVEVARIGSSSWAVGVRGFASALSRSLLVLIDGRPVYSPLFAGVFWDVQDVLLEDIDRIEVIRGPGGTLWGANAVNGVINVITRRAGQSQGGLATAGGGTEERGFGSARHGGTTRRGVDYRVYAKGFERDAVSHPDGDDFDDWRMAQAGFRVDREAAGRDGLTLQGDAYVGEAGDRTTVTTFSPPFSETRRGDSELSGGNLLARWRRATGDASDLALQLFYDRTDRRELSFREARDTFDADLQRRTTFGRRHRLVWGAGYRLSTGEVTAGPTIAFEPPRRTDHLFAAFLQDEVELVRDRLRLIAGTKLEHNDYSGFELQPNGRLLWTPTPRQAIWGAVSRAVRTPSRVEHDLSVTALLDASAPAFVRVIGDEAFGSERLVAYELGYRVQPVKSLRLDLTAFYDRYRGLLSLERGLPFSEASPPPSHTVVPLFIRNGMRAEAYGFETAIDWAVLERWRVGAAYGYLQLDLRREPWSQDATTEASTEGGAPRHQASVRSFLDLRRDLELNLLVRYVDDLPAHAVDAYVTVDAVIQWRPVPSLEVSLVGQNLVEARHAEFAGAGAGEVERGVYGKASWRW